MENNTFVKIENKVMPVDEFNFVSLEQRNKHSSGVINFMFLLSIIIISFMWVLLIFFRK